MSGRWFSRESKHYRAWWYCICFTESHTKLICKVYDVLFVSSYIIGFGDNEFFLGIPHLLQKGFIDFVVKLDYTALSISHPLDITSNDHECCYVPNSTCDKQLLFPSVQAGHRVLSQMDEWNRFSCEFMIVYPLTHNDCLEPLMHRDWVQHGYHYHCLYKNTCLFPIFTLYCIF